MCMCMYINMHMHMHMHMHTPAIIYTNYCKNVLIESNIHVVESAYADVMMVGIRYKILLELTVVGGEGDC